jgi:Spy/CpxP family protein refolding chaperone
MSKSLATLPAIAVQLLLACVIPNAAAQSISDPSAYAGQQTRAIKSLSAEDVEDLLAGRGAGLAKAAELNGYPGPAHVLELKDQLQLSEAQLAATQTLMAQHRAAAKRLGKEVVASERSLDQAFGSHAVDDALVSTLTATAARSQGELRAEHLKTHLAQTALLTPYQVQIYAELRGYSKPEVAPAQPHQHHGE